MRKIWGLFSYFILPVAVFSLFAACDDDNAQQSFPAEILSFRLDLADYPFLSGQPEITEGGEIVLTAVPGTDPEKLKAVKPVIKVPYKCTVTPASGEAVDLSNGGVKYTVTSEGGSVKEYTFKCVIEKYEDAQILKLWFDDEFIQSNDDIPIPDEGMDIPFYVPYGVEDEALSALQPHFEISAGATIDPQSGAPQDFSQGFGDEEHSYGRFIPRGRVEYTVTSEKGDKNIYTLTALMVPSDMAEIMSVSFDPVEGLEISGAEIDNDARTVKFYVPYATDRTLLANLKLNIEVSPGATVEPADGSTIDLSGESAQVVVSAQDGTLNAYTVSVEELMNTETMILSLGFAPVEGLEISEADIDHEAGTITFTVPFGTDQTLLAALEVIVTVSDGATVEPAEGSKIDLSEGKTVGFTVTSEDEQQTANYAVSVKEAPSTQTEIVSISFVDVPGLEISDAAIDHDAQTVKFYVPYNTDPAKLKELELQLEVSPGAVAVPGNGDKVDLSGEPVKITVTAQDESRTVYTVSVIESDNTEAEIVSLTFDRATELGMSEAEIDHVDETITFTVPYGTDREKLKDLTLVMTVSDGASAVPANGETIDLSGEFGVITVTSQDGNANKSYKVYVGELPNEDAMITEFSFEPVAGLDLSEATISQVEGNSTITFTAPYGTDQEKLKALKIKDIELSPGASSSHNAGDDLDLSEGKEVVITVTAANGTDTNTYKVSCTVLKNSEAKLENLDVSGSVITDKKLTPDNGLEFTVAWNATEAQLKDIALTFDKSGGSTVTVGSQEITTGDKGVFTEAPAEVTLTVTPEDGGTPATYKIVVKRDSRPESNKAELNITGLSDPDGIVKEGLSNVDKDYSFTVKWDADAADISQLGLNFTKSEGSTVTSDGSVATLVSGQAAGFVAGQTLTITVTSADGVNYDTFTVTCVREEKQINTEAKIEITGIQDQYGITVGEMAQTDDFSYEFYVEPDAAAGQIGQLGVNFTNVSVGAKVTINGSDYASGQTANFNAGTPVEIKVTAEDGVTVNTYKVTAIQLQKITYDFEEWSRGSGGILTKYYYDYPTSWTTTNHALATASGKSAEALGWSINKATGLNSSTAVSIKTMKIDDGGLVPLITSGSLYRGQFYSLGGLGEPLNATRFGESVDYKPVKVVGWFKYTPGDDYYYITERKSPLGSSTWEINPQMTDKCTLSAVFYEGGSSTWLTGIDIMDSDKIVADAREFNGEQQEWKYFELLLDWKDGKIYNPDGAYKLALVFASSFDGSVYAGAPGSTLYLDDIEVWYAE